MENIENKTTDKKLTLCVSSSPHRLDVNLTTKNLMLDVIISLIPLMIMSLYLFKSYALLQLFICVISSLSAETFFLKIRNKPTSINDFSAVVTGIILALSLPWSAPWYVGVIASFSAIGFGKVVFGGLGQNIFNPAMVGRAFVMICFPAILGASAFVSNNVGIDIVTSATPLTIAKQSGNAITSVWMLFIGNVNGCLGETSALACIIGGLYLCFKKTASWEVPFGIILTVFILGGLNNILNPKSLTVLEHLLSGALLFGAFFIATDPVTNPLTSKGKFIFGIGLGFFIMIIRIFSGYPEGVMFAVLIMNSLTPLINRMTIPRPIGGPLPLKKA